MPLYLRAKLKKGSLAAVALVVPKLQSLRQTGATLAKKDELPKLFTASESQLMIQSGKCGGQGLRGTSHPPSLLLTG